MIQSFGFSSLPILLHGALWTLILSASTFVAAGFFSPLNRPPSFLNSRSTAPIGCPERFPTRQGWARGCGTAFIFVMTQTGRAARSA